MERSRNPGFGFGLALAVVAGLAGAAGACVGGVDGVQAGLANAQSPEAQSRPLRHHDVIANAKDSCPRVAGAADPLPNRAPPCDDTFEDAGPPPPPPAPHP